MDIKKATTTDEQIKLLRERGMLITNEEHAKKVLLSVGYYRMGFYWYHFERNQNVHIDRNHKFRKDTTWEKAEALYKFDDRFRNIVSFYLQAIETDIRTYITYIVSNFYKEDPIWFSKLTVMTPKFVTDELPKIIASVGKNEVIRRHYRKHPDNMYAPAWKTLEFLTFGETQILFCNIRNSNLKRTIYERYDIHSESQFVSYLDVLRNVRNVCAHSHILYDKKLYAGIRGNATKLGLLPKEETNIVGILKLIYYMLRQFKPEYEIEMKQTIRSLVNNQDYKDIYFLISRIAF